jgi:cell division protein FtsB
MNRIQEPETVESLRIKLELLQAVLEKKAEEMAKLEKRIMELCLEVETLKDLI